MREPLDTDKVLPTVLNREAAADLLANLVPPHLADAIWDEIIAPLYDARTMRLDWQRGRCIRCSAVHPGNSRELDRYRGRREDAIAHQQHCPKYVGPLDHRAALGHQGSFGWRASCSCGQSWLEYDDDGNRRECPDAAVDWRGPRPEADDLLGREEAPR